MGPAVVFFHQKRSLPSLSESPTCLWSLCHSPHCGQPIISWGGETPANHLVQGWDCMEHAWKFPTVCAPTFFHYAHMSCLLQTTDRFPHIPFIHCTFTIYMNNLPVNFRQMNIFSIQNCIINCTSEVLEFSLSCLTFNEYSNRGKKIKKPYYTKNMFPLMTGLHRICAHHLHNQYS